MAKMIMAGFPTAAAADQMLRSLEDRGYQPGEISVISKDQAYQDRGYSAGGEVARGVGSGAATGGVIGGLAGLLAGTGVFPALAGLFIGGPIAAALGLAGAAATTASGVVTGVAAGGLIGALTSLGLSHESAARYDETVQGGGVVLGVSCDDAEAARCRALLEEGGAHEIQTVTADRPARADRETGDRREERLSERSMRGEPAFGERRTDPHRDDPDLR